ncbi:MAG: hypothetical protein FWB72_06445 [Firmicutes bacterium]|nr:hypothetical protein [Bacillota bacterium]
MGYFSSNRAIYGLRQQIKYHYNINSGKYFLFCFCAIVGCALGLFAAFNAPYEYVLVYSSLPVFQTNFFLLTTGQITLTSYFIANVFNASVVFIAIFLLGWTIYTIPILFVIVGYRGYAIAYDSVMLIAHLGTSGIVNLIIIVLPINILVLLMFISGSVASLNRCILLRNTASLSGTECGIPFFVKRILLVFALTVAIYLVEMFIIFVLLFSVGAVL